MGGSDTNFAEVTTAEINEMGENLAFTMGEIDDLVNVGLNYIVTVGDISSFPGYDADPGLNAATFTIRITPVKDASGMLPPTFVGQAPTPELVYASSDAAIQMDPSPEFVPASLLTARVADADLNTDPSIIDITTVEVTADDGITATVTLTLEELGVNRGVFAANLPDEFSNVALGTTVTVIYEDVAGGAIPNEFITAYSTAVAVLGAGTIQFDPVTYSYAENGGTATVVVTRVNGTAGIVTVDVLGNNLVIEDTNGGATIFSDVAGLGSVLFGDVNDPKAGALQFDHSTNSIYLKTLNTDAIIIDNNQNIGLGTAPSTNYSGSSIWLNLGPNTYFHANSTPTGAGYTSMLQNAYFHSISFSYLYLSDGYASLFQQDTGGFFFQSAPSGLAGNVATMTDLFRMTNAGAVSGLVQRAPVQASLPHPCSPGPLVLLNPAGKTHPRTCLLMPRLCGAALLLYQCLRRA